MSVSAASWLWSDRTPNGTSDGMAIATDKKTWGMERTGPES